MKLKPILLAIIANATVADLSAMQALLLPPQINTPIRHLNNLPGAVTSQSWFKNKNNLAYLVVSGFFASLGCVALYIWWQHNAGSKAREELYRLYGDGIVHYLNERNQLDINERDYARNTVVHYAVNQKKPEMLREFMQRGANIYVNTENAFCHTPVHKAIEIAATNSALGEQLLNILIQNGAQGNSTQSPFLRYYFEELGFCSNNKLPSLAIVEKLLAMEASPNSDCYAAVFSNMPVNNALPLLDPPCATQIRFKPH